MTKLVNGLFSSENAKNQSKKKKSLQNLINLVSLFDFLHMAHTILFKIEKQAPKYQGKVAVAFILAFVTL
jgi:hypothetical protein